MKTTHKTEFAAMGLKPDGTWRTLGPRFTNVAEEYPGLYTAYPEYRIAKRDVTTTYTEWEEI